MALPSEIFTGMVTATDHLWTKTIADNVSKHNALYRRLQEKGNVKTWNGGLDAVLPLDYAENQSFQRYFGADKWNMATNETLTSAVYPFVQSAIIVTATGREIRQNAQSETRMLDYVKARKLNAVRTATNNMSVDIFSDGSLPNQMGGLQLIIQANGQGTVGGINSTTWPFWRNQFREATGTNTAASPSVANADTFVADMEALWMKLVRGADKPDLIVMSHDFYQLFSVFQRDKVRYAGDTNKARTGIDSLPFHSADVIYDDNANFLTTSETAYFLNTDYLWLYQHADAKWSPEAPRTPTDQDVIAIPYLWFGAMCCSNRSLQGRLIDAA